MKQTISVKDKDRILTDFMNHINSTMTALTILSGRGTIKDNTAAIDFLRYQKDMYIKQLKQMEDDL